MIRQICRRPSRKDRPTKKKQCLSFRAHGSCFVGKVHILNTSKNVYSEKMNSPAEKIRAQIKYGSCISNAVGGFGASGQFASNIKTLSARRRSPLTAPSQPHQRINPFFVKTQSACGRSHKRSRAGTFNYTRAASQIAAKKCSKPEKMR